MKVLLVVIDGAAPRVVCPAIQTGQLPHLKRLADAGEMHQAATTIFPSITPAATTSIITGAYPAQHGIAGAAWYDEARDEIAYYGDDFWVIAKEGFGEFLRDFLVRLNGDRLTAPTLFETIEGQGRKAACLNYLVHRGLHTHKVHVPWLLSILPGVPLTETVLGPTTLSLGNFVTGRSPHRHRHLDGKSGLLHRFGMDDEATANLLCELVDAQELPDFTVAYFADNDFRSHEVGPHAALPTIERVDRALGAMFDAAGGFDAFMRDTCVIVTSDHGHCDILADRDAAVITLQEVLADFTHGDLGKAWREGDELLVCPNMRAAQIYLRHRSPELIERVARTALLDPRVDLIMWKDDAYVIAGPRGRLEFRRAQEGWRWDGDAELLQLEGRGREAASTEYPNAFERIAGVLDARQSGDLWLTAQPGCEFEVPGGKAHLGGGSHGALHALDSLVPVIAAGAPRRLPLQMRSVDIAPLCLDALGIRATAAPGASPSRPSPHSSSGW